MFDAEVCQVAESSQAVDDNWNKMPPFSEQAPFFFLSQQIELFLAVDMELMLDSVD